MTVRDNAGRFVKRHPCLSNRDEHGRFTRKTTMVDHDSNDHETVSRQVDALLQQKRMQDEKPSEV